MGVWDAMGQGIQAGVNTWLERLRQQKEGSQNQALLDLRQKELGLNQANAVREQDLVADAQARAEQEKRVGGYGKLSDFSDPSKGIFVYEWQELSPGAYVPIPREEQMRQYQEQFAQWEAREAAKSQTEYGRELTLARVRAQGGEGAKMPDDTQTLLQQLYGKDGRLNTAIATSLFTRMLQAQLPPGMPVNPVDMLRGQEGVRRAQDIAIYLGSAASSYHPGRPVQKDLLTFLSGMSPDLANFLNPPPPPPARPPGPTTGMTFPPLGGAGGAAVAPSPAIGAGASVRELLPGGTPAVTEKSATGRPMRMTDASGRNWYWDAAQGMWMQE